MVGRKGYFNFKKHMKIDETCSPVVNGSSQVRLRTKSFIICISDVGPANNCSCNPLINKNLLIIDT